MVTADRFTNFYWLHISEIQSRPQGISLLNFSSPIHQWYKTKTLKIFQIKLKKAGQVVISFRPLFLPLFACALEWIFSFEKDGP